jgi:hypothetical protein
MALKVILFYFDHRDSYQFYKHFNQTWTLLSCSQLLFSTLSSGHPILDAELQPLRHGVGQLLHQADGQVQDPHPLMATMRSGREAML